MDGWFARLACGGALAFLASVLVQCGPDSVPSGGAGDGSAGDGGTAAAETDGLTATGGGPGGADTHSADSADGTTADRATSGDSSGDGPATRSCTTDAAHGAWLGDLDATGLTIYEGCAAGEYFVEHGGTTVLDSTADFDSLGDDAFVPLVGIEGVMSAGIGNCCEGSSAACVIVDVSVVSLTAATFFTELQAALPDSDDCYGIVIMPAGLTGPRCEDDDPDCGPLPGGSCDPSVPPVVPGADRLPVAADLSSGACSHDGECIINGDGSLCTDWAEPPSVGLLQCHPEIDEAYCGCVDDQCHWYVQGDSP